MDEAGGRSGRMSPDDIAKVRESTSLVQLMEEITMVKRSGTSFLARCPFHDDSSPSMSINESLGLYKCFGCQEAGDVVTFVQKSRNLDFRSAVEFLADRSGITLTFEESEEEREARLHRRKLEQAITDASAWYQTELVEGESGAEARQYLRSRGVDGDTARRFHLGWSPLFNDVTKHVRIDRDVAIESGVSVTGRNNQLRDKLHARVIFPINDAGGRPLGLAGRVLPGSDSPAKYMNFAETPLYQKRKALYGLDLAKQQIVATNEVVVCEGQMDVVSCHIAGIDNAVATCGIALTEDHMVTLGRFARKVVIAFDADSAGQNAIEKMHQWEQRHQVTITVAYFPGGKDPGQLVEQGQMDDLRAAITSAQPLLGWRLNRLFTAGDLSTPESRVTLADEASAMVLQHPDKRIAIQYVDLIAERCGVDVTALRNQLSPTPQHRPSTQQTHTLTSPGSSRQVTAVRRNDVEYDALTLAVNRPEDVVAWFGTYLFTDSVIRAAGEALLESNTIAEAALTENADVRGLLVTLDAEPEPDDIDIKQTKEILILAASERYRFEHQLSPDDEGLLLRMEMDGSQGDDAALDRLNDWLAAAAERDAAIAATAPVEIDIEELL